MRNFGQLRFEVGGRRGVVFSMFYVWFGVLRGVGPPRKGIIFVLDFCSVGRGRNGERGRGCPIRLPSQGDGGRVSPVISIARRRICPLRFTGYREAGPRFSAGNSVARVIAARARTRARRQAARRRRG